MWKPFSAALVIVTLSGACREGDRDTGAVDDDRVGADTIIESETVRDTTIVTADTAIDVDTVKKTDNIEENRE